VQVPCGKSEVWGVSPLLLLHCIVSLRHADTTFDTTGGARLFPPQVAPSGRSSQSVMTDPTS
jgi:hypothetical protein